MAIDTFNVLTISQGIASGAPYGTGDPGVPSTSPTAPGAPWYDFGAISTDGLSENLGQSRQEFKRWGAISPFAAVLTDTKHEFKVTFLETNPAVLGLFYRVGTPTPSGTSTNEVQTVTITGTPTGGSFTLVFNGQATTAIAYNAAASAVQTALQALSTIGAGNATVSGGPGPGTPYTVTFTGTLAAANVPSMTAVGNFTGGTSPTVGVSTPTGGASGSILSVTDDTTGARDVRAFCFDLIQGTNHLRFYVPQGEVTDVGSPVYKTDDMVQYETTITAYPSSTGVAVQRYFLTDAIRLGL